VGIKQACQEVAFYSAHFSIIKQAVAKKRSGFFERLEEAGLALPTCVNVS
jgi:hypothetical protein